jgi:hypothetical protein
MKNQPTNQVRKTSTITLVHYKDFAQHAIKETRALFIDNGWRSGLNAANLQQPMALKVAAPMKASKSYPSIDREMRSHVGTDCAAFWLNRQSQTLRSWASTELGPLRPIRINGRLAWSVLDIKKILNGISK